MLDIKDLRKEYSAHALDISDVEKHPIMQFKKWFEEAMKAEVPEPNAFNLATADKNGKPSARIVLLKSFDENGFIFFTNYNSRKGQEIEENPQAAMAFLWHELQRQVRVEGSIEKISEKESTDYFKSRPKGSQIGAWASPQSQVIPDRQVLKDKVSDLEQEYQDEETLPKPAHWGGYRIIPNFIEFWQGRPSRLHDRIAYHKNQKGDWNIERLAP